MNRLYGISRRLFDSLGDEIIFSKGEGCYVYDSVGRKYIDLILGYGPIVLGHGNITYADYMYKAILDGTTFPSYGEKQIKLAERLDEVYPNHQLIAVYQSGSDTLETALKICRYITGCHKFIRFGYIGWLDELFTGGLNWHEPINSTKYNKSAIHNKFNSQAMNWNGDDITEFERLCSLGDIACLMVDAYQIERHPKCNFDKVVELCQKNSILLVLDETKTAGRVCPYGYYKERYDFDFTVLGKAIGNGVPVSLLLGNLKYQSIPYDSIKIAGTYARDLFGCEAILGTEKIMTEMNGYERVSQIGIQLAKRMNKCIQEVKLTEDLYVNVLLDGGILEFEYSENLANNFEVREKFSDILLRNQLIIPNGHCFYICTEHGTVLDEIENSFTKAVYELLHIMA